MVAQIDAKFIRARPWKIWSRLLAYALFEGRPLTTRGRWINPLVFAGYRLWSVLPLRKRDLRPIFVMGVGRSGTTVLGTVLALHRDVGYLNEPKALWHAALGDDDLIGSYGATPGRYIMTGADGKNGRAKRLRRFYQAFLRLSFSRRIVDKYPELIFRNGLIDVAFPDARKVVLLRNGTDICQSIENWPKAHGQADADWWGLNDQKWHLLVEELVMPDAFFADVLPVIRQLGRHVDRAAVEWMVTMREADRLRVSGARGFLFIRYEDLVAAPYQILCEILDFCDLSQDRLMLGYSTRILKPRRRHVPPNLNPVILPLFNQTMKTMGYKTGRAR
ncbi:MAG: sulfotransferase family protein [Paracoccaceae bacterium]